MAVLDHRVSLGFYQCSRDIITHVSCLHLLISFWNRQIQFCGPVHAVLIMEKITPHCYCENDRKISPLWVLLPLLSHCGFAKKLGLFYNSLRGFIGYSKYVRHVSGG